MEHDVVAQTIKEQQRYLDGCFRSIRDANGVGKPVSLEQMKFDARVLKHIRLKDIHREGQLASYLGLTMRDDVFQESLERLETFGLIKRTLRKWDYHGLWIELADEDKKLDVTARGLAVEMNAAEMGFK
jgi:hypothetical protein